MKKIIIFLNVTFLLLSLNAELLHFSIDTAQKTQQTKILLAFIAHENKNLEEIGIAVKNALEFTNQITTTIAFFPKLISKQEALQQKTNGFNYIVFIADNKDNFEWHLFEIDNGSMKKGKKITKKCTVLRSCAYALADSLYEAFTNEPGFFSTKIAYTKQIPLSKGKHYTHLFIADYDGSNEQCIIGTPTINVSPRWNKDINRPLLFYSENTNTNMRLVAVDMHKKRTIASNFDGLNMLPAFSPDGKSVVYCATRGSGNCQLYYWSNKVLKKITQNEGNNFFPIFSGDGTIIYFSSDFESKYPQIYAYNLQTHTLEKITHDGYCVSPSFCAQSNKLAYTKSVQGIMQVFCYDIASGKHSQLTFDKAQKEDCSWSLCDNFLLCSVADFKSSRIALFNTITQEYRYLTDAKDHCSSPTWSGIYAEYPIVT